MAQYSCDSQGVCMVCKLLPPEEEKLNCITCTTPWHVPCLSSSSLPATIAATNDWQCPDCSDLISAPPPPQPESHKDGPKGESVSSITKVESLVGKSVAIKKGKKDKSDNISMSDILTRTLNCPICLEILDRPITIPCGHSFCLKCFEKWIEKGNKTCANCRQSISAKVAKNIRINSTLVFAIRMARAASNNNGGAGGSSAAASHFLHDNDKPDEPYTTSSAKKNGVANARSGKIFVTVPRDHFGPIPPENDPTRNQGLRVGESWKSRLQCRQWGAHFFHLGGIAGQSNRGAQSVALSGGYVDDKDNGEWFLYTGSGGKDLSGNKRTNKKHSSDQKFEGYNRALQISCLEGYPVRVVRSHLKKQSKYAPEEGVRYEGIYRIEKYWKIVGLQGFTICRFLFIRCDNEPAPWLSDTHGDRPKPLPVVPELEKATNIRGRTKSPAWDFDAVDSTWKWMKPPPPSGIKIRTGEPKQKGAKKFKGKSIKEKLHKGFSCFICKKVMVSPVTTPCAHNFCKPCLEGVYAGKSFVKERSGGGFTLRSKKVVMKCPSCTLDISDYLQNLRVNIDLKEVIESLKAKAEENEGPLDSSDEHANACKDDEGNGSTEVKEAPPDEAVRSSVKRKKSDSGEKLGDKGDEEKAKRGRKSTKAKKSVE